MAAFIWMETRVEEPLIPLQMFRYPAFTISCIVLFIAFFEMVSLTVLIPLRLQMTSGADVERAAFELLPLTLAVPLGAFISGRIMARTGHYKPFQLAGTMIAPIAICALALIDPRQTLPTLFCMAAAGIGLGVQLPASTVAVQNTVPARFVGIATATSASFRSFGAGIGVATLTSLLFSKLRENVPAIAISHSGAEFLKDVMGEALLKIDEGNRMQLAIRQSFQDVFLMGAAVALLSFALVTLISNESLRDHV